MTEVRTRFAPSPTGFQHLGGFRTAFFAYLLAKRNGGKFLLRVEDTDQERRVPGAIKFLYDELAWFGALPDEAPGREELTAVNECWDGAPDIGGPVGPYIQSLRLEKYKAVAEELISKGFAYRCDCTAEMLERERNEQTARKESPGYSGYCRSRNVPATSKHVVRLKIPTKKGISYEDAIAGLVSWETIPHKDPVMLKSDGFPTYHLAVVVDDHAMKISHVLRGVEWLPSTPIHLYLYEVLGWIPPQFAHLPVINGSDGKKLSKRTGAAATNVMREEGYLPEALLNFAVLIGWAPGEGSDQEIFTREDLISKFSLHGINKASGFFDPQKLLWMNGLYIRNLSNEEFTKRALPFIEKAGITFNAAKWDPIAPHVKERVKLLTEVPEMVKFLFVDQITRDMSDMFQKGIDKALAKKIIERAIVVLNSVSDFTHTTLEAALRPLGEEFGLKVGPLFTVLRIAVTGKKVTPPLFESFAALGKEIVLARLQETLPLPELA